MSFADRLQTAWNSRDEKQVAALYTEDGGRRFMGFDDQSPYDREGMAELVRTIFDAWPDSVLDIRSSSEGADGTITVEWTFRGTHQKDWRILPAKGEETVLNGVCVYAMEGDLVREERAYWDNAVLMAGSGLLG